MCILGGSVSSGHDMKTYSKCINHWWDNLMGDVFLVRVGDYLSLESWYSREFPKNRLPIANALT